MNIMIHAFQEIGNEWLKDQIFFPADDDGKTTNLGCDLSTIKDVHKRNTCVLYRVSHIVLHTQNMHEQTQQRNIHITGVEDYGRGERD